MSLEHVAHMLLRTCARRMCGWPGARRTFSKMRQPEDPFKVLGVPPTATMEETKAAYFANAVRCHPDLNQADDKASEQMQALNAARDSAIAIIDSRTGTLGQADQQAAHSEQRSAEKAAAERAAAAAAEQKAADEARSAKFDFESRETVRERARKKTKTRRRAR